MNDFGLKAAIALAISQFEIYSRNTGRTSMLIESCHDGDTIVCLGPTKSYIVGLARELGKSIHVMSVPVSLDLRPHLGTRDGAVHFDHAWIEEYYRLALRSAGADLFRQSQYLSKVWRKDGSVTPAYRGEHEPQTPTSRRLVDMAPPL